MEYIQANKEEPDRTRVRVLRALDAAMRTASASCDATSTAFVTLAKYPYNPGHLLVLPVRHVGDLEELTAEENAEHRRAAAACACGRSARPSAPHGFNVGPEPRPGRRRRDPGAPALARGARAGAATRTSCRSSGETRVLPELLAGDLREARAALRRLMRRHDRARRRWAPRASRTPATVPRVVLLHPGSLGLAHVGPADGDRSPTRATA